MDKQKKKLLCKTKIILVDTIIEQQDYIKELENTVEKLKTQVNKNSKNSHKPPSTDGFKKTTKKRSQRKKSDKKSGGQAGHKGTTLLPNPSPDKFVEHEVNECANCKTDLTDVPPVKAPLLKQEIDLPEITPITTEHIVHVKKCPFCNHVNYASAPAHLNQRVQYGPRIKSWITYFHEQQLLPIKRTQDVFQDCFSLKMSEGTIVNVTEECHQLLEEAEKEIKKDILSSEVVHFDETGMRALSKTQWLHVASNDQSTCYFIHRKRGSDAMNEMAVLPNYSGIAVHDHWKPYFKYTNCTHGLCNAHHLRELTAMHENHDQTWAKKMHEHLLKLNQAVEDARCNGAVKLPNNNLKRYSKEYDKILKSGKGSIPIIETEKIEGKRGKRKQHPAKNLYDRLINFKEEVLRFMYDFRVPFTNNLGERDIRMTKVKQKISGCFRSTVKRKTGQSLSSL